jgi:hypothetical protein
VVVVDWSNWQFGFRVRSVAARKSRSRAAPDPQAVHRLRRRRTQLELAKEVTAWLRQGGTALPASISEREILKIEKGQEVDTHLLMPVLVFLGLEDEPSLKRPRPGQHPGEWIRDLRDRYGIGLTPFCEAAVRPDDGRSKRAGRPLSATTVLAIESGENRFPRDTTKDALVNGFAAYGVDIAVESLEQAWRKVAPEAVRAWIAEYEADLPAATPAAPVHEYADPAVPSADDVVKNLGPALLRFAELMGSVAPPMDSLLAALTAFKEQWALLLSGTRPPGSQQELALRSARLHLMTRLDADPESVAQLRANGHGDLLVPILGDDV